MSLPEPSFIDRDPQAITTEIVAQYELLTGKTLYPAQVERLLIDVIDYRETLVRIGIQEAAKQNLVAYAREHPVRAILCVDDSAQVIAARACRELGLAYNAPEAALAAKDASTLASSKVSKREKTSK